MAAPFKLFCGKTSVHSQDEQNAVALCPCMLYEMVMILKKF